jgi:hypothetical protein
MAIELKLGDRLEKLIQEFIPQSVIDKVQSRDGGCGCSERKVKLNNLDRIFN